LGKPAFLSLIAFVLFSAILSGDPSMPVERIPDLFSETQIQSVQERLDKLLSSWKTSKNTKKIYAGNKLKQLDILITRNPDRFHFIKLEFNAEHELTERSVKDLKERLYLGPYFFKSIEKELKKVTFELFLIAIDQFAKREQLVGEHEIRADLRGFIVYFDKKHSEEPLSSNLGWHWDYCSRSTLVAEIYSDFEAAGLLFARNIYPSPLPDCTKLLNGRNAIPDEETLVAVDYPENGALYFPSERGGVIHCPQQPLVKMGKRGLLMRLILQVVLMDQEWVEMSTHEAIQLKGLARTRIAS